MLEEREGLLGHPEPAPKRRTTRGFALPRVRASLSFILIAVISGLIFYLVVFIVILSKAEFKATSKHYLFGDEDVPDDGRPWLAPPGPPGNEEFDVGWDGGMSEHHASTRLGEVNLLPSPPPSATPTLASEEGLLELTVDELKAMVARTKGYFVRDWSLYLGWNNMRYIIEAAVLQADMLGRTLVLPSFVYSRACEYHIEVCAKYAHMVNRGDALSTDEWRNIPMERQMGWVLPIEIMIDVPHLRKKHNVMLMTEYLHLQGLNLTNVRPNGGWDREYYHSGIDRPTLFVIPNHIYDPEDVVRIDTMPSPPFVSLGNPNATVEHFKANQWTPPTEFGRACNVHLLESAFEKKRVWLDWAEAVEALRWTLPDYNNTSVEDALKAAGWFTLHTWDGALGMEFVKSVVKPIKQVVRYPSLRGFIDDYSYVTQGVLLLEGETHLGRKPGGMRFTTPEKRDDFSRIVLQDIHPPPRVKALALKLIARMDKLNNDRLWLAGHMRRGDFVDVGWAMEGGIRDHLGRIMQRLALGRQILERLHYMVPLPYDAPDVVPNNMATRLPPKDGSYIYLATDERSNEAMRIFQQSGIKLFSDLVTIDDRREFGWPLLFSDVIALVEQQVIGNGAGYFYAHAMSSVAGGILNIRAASGCDSRTALLD